MRKSPGFDVGHWLIQPNKCPSVCATYISESFRACEWQRNPIDHTVLSLKKSRKSAGFFRCLSVFFKQIYRKVI